MIDNIWIGIIQIYFSHLILLPIAAGKKIRRYVLCSRVPPLFDVMSIGMFANIFIFLSSSFRSAPHLVHNHAAAVVVVVAGDVHFNSNQTVTQLPISIVTCHGSSGRPLYSQHSGSKRTQQTTTCFGGCVMFCTIALCDGHPMGVALTVRDMLLMHLLKTSTKLRISPK